MDIEKRDRLYTTLMNCKKELKEVEKKEIEIMEKNSTDKYFDLIKVEEEVDKKSQEYIKARDEFLKFAKELN